MQRMTDNELDRYGVELLWRVKALIDAYRAAGAKSQDPDEAVWQARLALAELAIGDDARGRMQRGRRGGLAGRAADGLENLDTEDDLDNRATRQRREHLMMLVQFLTDLRRFGFSGVIDLTVSDRAMAAGQEPRVLYPAEI
jgi:hypothetical protein